MRGTPVIFDKLNGGVNLVDAPYALGDAEARDARDFVGELRGKARKRDGAVTFAAPPVALDSLFPMESPTPFLVGSGAGQVFSISPAAAAVQLASGLAAAPWEWVQAPANGGQGPLYGMNGQEVPKFWDGVAAALGNWTAATGTLPNGKYLVYLANRLWVAGMGAYTTVDDPASTLVFSNLGNPRDWPTQNVVEFDPKDGQAITGLGTIGPYLLVFKSNKAWTVYDLDVGANRPLGRNVGCASHRSIVETPQGTMFLTEDQGVMVTDGSTAKPISQQVQPLIDTLSPAQRSAASGAYIGQHYYLSFSTGGVVNDVTLDYDLRTGTWWIHSLAEQDWAVWDSGDGAGPQLYGAKAGSQVVHRPFVPGVLTDDGAAFTAYLKRPFHVFGQPNMKKRVRQIVVKGKGKGRVDVVNDYSTVSTPEGEIDLASATATLELGEARIFTPGVAEAWSLIFTCDTADPLEIDEYVMAVQGRAN